MDIRSFSDTPSQCTIGFFERTSSNGWAKVGDTIWRSCEPQGELWAYPERVAIQTSYVNAFDHRTDHKKNTVYIIGMRATVSSGQTSRYSTSVAIMAACSESATCQPHTPRLTAARFQSPLFFFLSFSSSFCWSPCFTTTATAGGRWWCSGWRNRVVGVDEPNHAGVSCRVDILYCCFVSYV